MSATLGAAKALTYRSRTIVEVPAKTGQFITLFSTAEVALKRPDKLRARLTGEAPNFDFYYDGATASAFAPVNKSIPLLKPRRQSTPWSLRCSRRLVSASFPPLPFQRSLWRVDAETDQRHCRRSGGGQRTPVPASGISVSWRELGSLIESGQRALPGDWR